MSFYNRGGALQMTSFVICFHYAFHSETSKMQELISESFAIIILGVLSIHFPMFSMLSCCSLLLHLGLLS